MPARVRECSVRVVDGVGETKAVGARSVSEGGHLSGLCGVKAAAV
jgi:hypothetical protein